MHSCDGGSHPVKFNCYCFTGFWNMAGNENTHTHTCYTHNLVPSSMFIFSKSSRLSKQKEKKERYKYKSATTCKAKQEVSEANTTYYST